MTASTASAADVTPSATNADIAHLLPVTGGRMRHLPPLDGIRGLGIPFVLLYHHEAVLFGQRFGGGYLTVSMFFTLSGFLITRLLVNEHDRKGRIDLKAFYVRRFKRLMPAALVTLLLIAQAWWLAPPPNGGVRPWSWFSALSYWQNWYLIFQGNSYNDLFKNASPLQHMWSLSLEEQVYIAFPLVMVGVLAFTAVRRRAAGTLFGLASVGYALGWFWSARVAPDRAYYALEARSAEFLIGAAFAVWWMRSPRVPALIRWLRSSTGRSVAWVVLGLEVLVWYCVNLNTTIALPALPLFPFWVVVNGLLVCTIMGYACAEAGASRFLGWRPLVWLGQLSYGIYLVHWPVFLFVSRERFPMNDVLLFTVRVAITMALTLLIFHLVEDPVRRGTLWRGRTFGTACAGLAAVGLLTAVINPPNRIDQLVRPDYRRLQRELLDSLPALGADAPAVSATDPTLPARVLFVGDSQSWALGSNMQKLWGTPRDVTVVPDAGVGCGVSELTPQIYLGTEVANGFEGCREWRDTLPKVLLKLRPQVVVIVGGFADLTDRRLPGSTAWTHIGETAYDVWLAGQMRNFAELMASTGARIVWMSHPYNRPARPNGTDPYPEESPERMDRYNSMIKTLADEDPRIQFADLAALLRARPGGEFDTVLRPDGAHIDLNVAPDLVDWIAKEISSAAAS